MSESVPKTREELAAHLEELGLRSGTYDLYGHHPDDAIVMDRRRRHWVVFYTERGKEFSTKKFKDEASACADLLERVLASDHVYFDLVVGPAPAEAADAAFDDWLSAHGTSREELSAADWKQDDVPWREDERWRRYFLRITTARRLTGRA